MHVRALIAVTAAAVTVACATQAPTTSAGPTDPPATTMPPVGFDSDHPAPIGTSVEPAAGWTVTVTAANLNGDGDMAAVNPYNRPQPGNRFVLANLTVRNGGRVPQTVYAAVKLSALSEGVARPVTFGLTPAPHFEVSAQLQPGGGQSGWVAFEVPATSPAVVLLAEPLFTVDQTKDQRFLALT